MAPRQAELDGAPRIARCFEAYAVAERAIHETIYGSSRQRARWEGDKAFTGVFNEPPAEPTR